MHVVVAFSPDYGSAEAPELGDAFWLAESPVNRAIADLKIRSQATDPNSAIFKWSGGEVKPAAIEGMYDTVALHHPTWSQISFVDVALTEELERFFRSEALQVSKNGAGFTVSRKVA